MISKPLLWFIGLAVLGVLIVTWWAGGYPARVAVINQNSTARDIVISTGGRDFQIGSLRGGETRIVRIPSGEPLEVRFTASRPRVWRSPDVIPPSASVTIYIGPDERVRIEMGVRRPPAGVR